MLFELIHNYSQWPRHWMNTWMNLFELCVLAWRFDLFQSWREHASRLFYAYVYSIVFFAMLSLLFLSFCHSLTLSLSLLALFFTNAPLEVFSSLIVYSPCTNTQIVFVRIFLRNFYDWIKKTEEIVTEAIARQRWWWTDRQRQQK